MSWINRIAETVARWLGRRPQGDGEDVLTAADEAVRERMAAASREADTGVPELEELPELAPQELADIEAVAAGELDPIEDPDLTPMLLEGGESGAVPDSHEQARHDVPAVSARVSQLQGQIDALRSTVYELTKTVQEIKGPTHLRKITARITGYRQVDGIARAAWIGEDARPIYQYAWREQKKVNAGYAGAGKDGGWQDVKLLKDGGHGIRGSVAGVTDGGTPVPLSGADDAAYAEDKNVAYNVMEANHRKYSERTSSPAARFNNGTLIGDLDWDGDDVQDGIVQPIAIDTPVELEPVTIWDEDEKEWVIQWRFYATNGIAGECPTVG